MQAALILLLLLLSAADAAAGQQQHQQQWRYPPGDCTTQCSMEAAETMGHCAADAAHGIPATTCAPVAVVAGGSSGSSSSSPCPTLRFADAFRPEAYCLPRFDADCTHPDNAGCARRCVLWRIVSAHCVADAYDAAARRFNASCGPCNMCWDRGGPSGPAPRHHQQHHQQPPEVAAVARQRHPPLPPYALLWARGPTGKLTKNHWLVLPKAPCAGIESDAPGCTDATGERLWAAAMTEARRAGFAAPALGAPPTWCLWLNAPNRRGQHQMHIHIAGFEGRQRLPDVPPDALLVRRLAAAGSISSDPSSPTRVLGEGNYSPGEWARGCCSVLRRPPANWARAYAVWVPTTDPESDLGVSARVFDLARALAAASDLPFHGYGIAVMPRRQHITAAGARSSSSSSSSLGGPDAQQRRQAEEEGRDGVVVAIVWSTTDAEQLDEEELAGDPIGFSRTCRQWADPAAAAPAAAAVRGGGVRPGAA